jgi:predicted nucleic acid-binding protein
MLIIADSPALIALATCDGLDLILRVYDEIKVPEAVFVENRTFGNTGFSSYPPTPPGAFPNRPAMSNRHDRVGQ